MVRIGDRDIGEGHPCFIIAEAGVNHNGAIEIARRLVETSARSGADAIKFQKRTVDDILVREWLDRPYTVPTSLGATYGEHRRRLELSDAHYEELSQLATRCGLHFLASVWDKRSADFLDELGVAAFKIPSADVVNLPLLEHVARKGKPIIMSTGMSAIDEIDEAVALIRAHHNEIVLLHCVSVYPCDNEDVNLRVMLMLRDRFECTVGYSGHERGIAIPVAAAALGASVIEKHVTLDRAMPGPDHAASLEPAGLQRLVHYIRIVEASLGSPEKRILEKEWPIRHRLAKSVVASVRIPQGTVISEEMLAVKGPGTGIKPALLPRLVGRIARMDVEADTLMPVDSLEW